jgi:hypothetical protein
LPARPQTFTARGIVNVHGAKISATELNCQANLIDEFSLFAKTAVRLKADTTETLFESVRR